MLFGQVVKPIQLDTIKPDARFFHSNWWQSEVKPTYYLDLVLNSDPPSLISQTFKCDILAIWNVLITNKYN